MKAAATPLSSSLGLWSDQWLWRLLTGSWQILTGLILSGQQENSLLQRESLVQGLQGPWSLPSTVSDQRIGHHICSGR